MDMAGCADGHGRLWGAGGGRAGRRRDGGRHDGGGRDGGGRDGGGRDGGGWATAALEPVVPQ